MAIFLESFNPLGFLEKLQLPPSRIFNPCVSIFLFNFICPMYCYCCCPLRKCKTNFIILFYFFIMLQFAFYMDAIENRTTITICKNKSCTKTSTSKFLFRKFQKPKLRYIRFLMTSC